MSAKFPRGGGSKPILSHPSMCKASSCFLESPDALSHTESQYSNSGRTKDMYICSNVLRLTLNFRARSKLSLVQAFVVIA